MRYRLRGIFRKYKYFFSQLSILPVIVSMFITGCITPRPRILTRVEDWHQHKKVDYVMPLYAKKLKGVKICLDPGHGGDGMLKGYKAGPTGVRESEVNLKVSLYLREFLEAVGANVVLTRDGDYYIGLGDRCKIANTTGCDFFVSMHHNAVSNPSPNHTIVFYHADPDTAFQNVDIARNIQREVDEVLRCPQLPWHAIGSDYLIYPGSGFGVLRRLEVPGALCESSFHSNPEEEQRLKTHTYNRREAYGYFLGIAKYVYDGIPKATLIQPKPGEKIVDKQPTIKLQLFDGWTSWKELIPSMIKMTFDGKVVQHTFDTQQGIVSYRPEQPLKNNYHIISVSMTNVYKNSGGKTVELQICPPIDKLVVQSFPSILPTDKNSIGLIKISAFDRDNEPVADGVKLSLATQYGILESTEVYTRAGYAWTYLYPDSVTNTTEITVTDGKIKSTCQINFDSLLTGTVDIYDVINQSLTTDSVFVPRLNLPVDVAVSQSQLYGEQEGTEPTRRNIIFEVNGLTPVKAAASGEIVAIDFSGESNEIYPYPNYVVIKHWLKIYQQDVYTIYANLNRIEVKPGELVTRGQVIGTVGKELVRCDVENKLVFELRVGENDPDYTRNPELWLESRTKNNGVIVGRISRTEFGPLPNIKITGVTKYPGIKGYGNSLTYGGGANSDEIFHENFAVTDVTAGNYKLSIKIGKETYTKNVAVEHGKISFIDWPVP